jgi:integrase
VLKALRPVWDQMPVTASRLRDRIELVLAYAMASGLRGGDNPAAWRGNLKAILGKALAQEHHAALPYAELPALMERLRAVEGIAARAVEFMILTATRTSEAINTTWKEIVPGLSSEKLGAAKKIRVKRKNGISFRVQPV